MTNFDFWKELGVKLPFSCVERSKLWWFRHLILMPPKSLPLEVFQARPSGWRFRADPEHAGAITVYPIWLGNTSSSPRKSYWMSCHHDPDLDKQWTMDGCTSLHKYTMMYPNLKAFLTCYSFFKNLNCGCHFENTKLTLDELFINIRLSECVDFLFVDLTVLWGELCKLERHRSRKTRQRLDNVRGVASGSPLLSSTRH